jgi:hypothetical protein
MKVEYPKWVYHPTEQAKIINEPPVPDGWYDHPDCKVDDKTITNEAEAVDLILEDLTKKELEELGRGFGLELDRRKKKETLIAEIREAI